MNTDIAAVFGRLSWRTLLVALLFGVGLQEQARARPADPTWIDRPTIRADDPPTDTRSWRYVPIGSCGVVPIYRKD